jgi:hypothetical protein
MAATGRGARPQRCRKDQCDSAVRRQFIGPGTAQDSKGLGISLHKTVLNAVVCHRKFPLEQRSVAG